MFLVLFGASDTGRYTSYNSLLNSIGFPLRTGMTLPCALLRTVIYLLFSPYRDAFLVQLVFWDRQDLIPLRTAVSFWGQLRTNYLEFEC